MPLTSTKRLRPEKLVNWHWPLSIGYLSENYGNNVIDKISQHGNWSKKLSYNYILNAGRLRCNVLLCEGTLYQIRSDFGQFEFDLNVDMVILQVDNYDGLEESAMEKMVSFLQSKTNASGVLFMAPQADPHYFVEAIIFNLSHNHSIEEVLDQILDKGVFYRTNGLVKASKLMDFQEKFWKGVRDLPEEKRAAIVKKANDSGTLDKIFKDPNVTITPADKPKVIIGDIIKASKGFEYQHEGDESSDIAESTREVLSEEKVLMSSGADTPKMQSFIKRVEPRFLQCRIQDDIGKSIMTYLTLNTVYKLNVRIGPGDKEWLNAGGIAPNAVTFTGETKEEIRVVVRIKGQTYVGNFFLPKSGASGEAIFNFAFNEAGQQLIEIYAYHKSRLIQMSALSLFVVDGVMDTQNVPFLNMEQMVSPRIVLDNLEDRMKFGTSFISTPEGKDHLLLDESHSDISTLPLETGMQDIINDIRKLIEKAVIKVKDHPEDIFHENNVKILRILAIKGSGLYQNYLKGKGDFDKPTQIISRKSDYVPFEFIFTDPTPKKTSKLCPNAKIALEKGSCENCEHRNDPTKKFFCPFGFLSLRTVIERHEYGVKKALLNGDDIGIYSEPIAGRNTIPIVENVVFGSAKRVESKSSNLIQQVSESIEAVSSEYTNAASWKDWKTSIETGKPKTLILISHTEQDDDALEELEIGDKDFVMKEEIDISFITKDHENNSPALFLIGCGTQDNTRRFVDFTSQFKNNGASIVLSTFTKIRGRQAGPIVQQLMKFLNERKGEKLRFGEIVLKLRQHLMSRGMLVSLALVAHGDADWIIEI